MILLVKNSQLTRQLACGDFHDRKEGRSLRLDSLNGDLLEDFVVRVVVVLVFYVMIGRFQIRRQSFDSRTQISALIPN